MIRSFALSYMIKSEENSSLQLSGIIIVENDETYNQSKVDVYENTIFYECETCKRKYTLKGLESGEIFTESIESDPLSENFILERRKKEFEKSKIRHRRLSNAWLVIAFVILFIIAWQDQSFNIMFFSPFILFGYGALRFFGR